MSRQAWLMLLATGRPRPGRRCNPRPLRPTTARRLAAAVPFLVIALTVAACGDSPTQPAGGTGVNVAGTWTGTWTFDVAGVTVTDDVTVVLTQNGSAVAGNWTAAGGATGQLSFPATASFSGTLSVSQRGLGGTVCSASTTITGTAASTTLRFATGSLPSQGVCQWGTNGQFSLRR